MQKNLGTILLSREQPKFGHNLVVLGTAENFVPRYTAVFRLRTAVLYRGIPRLDQNI